MLNGPATVRFEAVTDPEVRDAIRALDGKMSFPGGLKDPGPIRVLTVVEIPVATMVIGTPGKGPKEDESLSEEKARKNTITLSFGALIFTILDDVCKVHNIVDFVNEEEKKKKKKAKEEKTSRAETATA